MDKELKEKIREILPKLKKWAIKNDNYNCNNCGGTKAFFDDLENEIKCNHLNEFGELSYEIEDNRCSTDRGTFGSIQAICLICGEDISEEVESAKDSERENAFERD